MAQMTITIPDAALQRVLDALAFRHGYDSIPDPKPTRGEFSKSVVIGWLKEEVRQHELYLARLAAEQSTEPPDLT